MSLGTIKMSKYEIELRGQLSTKQKNKLENFLAKNGKLVKEYKRIQWCFDRNLQKKIDLRLKITNGEAEFSLKDGGLSEANRKEISIPIPTNKLKQAKDFLKILDYREGIIAWRNAKIYSYENIEWAIVEVPNFGYYFEAEKLVKNKKDGQEAENEIRSVTSKLGLKLMTAQETIEYIKLLDRKANKAFRL